MEKKPEWAQLEAMFAACDTWKQRYSLSRERQDAQECFFSGWEAAIAGADVDDAAHEYAAKKYQYEPDVIDAKRDFVAGFNAANAWAEKRRAA